MSVAPGFNQSDGEHQSSECCQAYPTTWDQPIAMHDANWAPMQAAAPRPTGAMPGPGAALGPVDDDDQDADHGEDPRQPLTCSLCGKHFTRFCDLNKHSRSHNRPFKCPDAACKYSTLGWPTEKELYRHVNDKHSSSPKMFACSFSPCGYRSKRESNCKQHMENTHGWTYVRSRAAKGESHAKDAALSDGADEALFAALPVPDASAVPPGQDFTLYPDHGDQSMAGDYGGGFLDLEAAGSYIPWKSPLTRLRTNEGFLQDFTQTFGTEPPMASGHQTSPPIDPALHAALGNYPIEGEMSPFGVQDPPLAPAAGMQAHVRPPEPLATAFGTQPAGVKSAASDEAVYFQAPQVKTEDTPDRRVSTSSGKRPLGHARVRSAASEITARLPDEPDDEEDEEDGDEPPRKRARAQTEDDLDDMEMPCPFRSLHPEIYNRDTSDKYGSCHTKHRNISTITRHLKRAAHRLHVDDRSISSFDVDFEGLGHPAAGLCKRCWQSWADRPAFESHLAEPCPNASRSKREKYHLMRATFCVLDRDGPAPSDASDAGFPGQEAAGSGADAGRPSPGPAAAGAFDDPTTPAAVAAGAPPPAGPETVRMSDHLALVQRVAALEEDNRRLQNTCRIITRALRREIRGGPPLPNPGQGNAAAAAAAGLARVSSTLTQDSARERESLVGGMDSQSTDLGGSGGEGDFEDDAARLLSEMASARRGPGRCAVRHVPLSPPAPRFAPAAEVVVVAAAAAPPGRRAQTWPGARPGPSVSDSGYASGPKVGSDGEARHDDGEARHDDGEARHDDDRGRCAGASPGGGGGWAGALGPPFEGGGGDYDVLDRGITDAEFDESISRHELRHIDG